MISITQKKLFEFYQRIIPVGSNRLIVRGERFACEDQIVIWIAGNSRAADSRFADRCRGLVSACVVGMAVFTLYACHNIKDRSMLFAF